MSKRVIKKKTRKEEGEDEKNKIKETTIYIYVKV